MYRVLVLKSLVFLIRDWYHQREYAHGLEGGENYLEVLLKVRVRPLEKKGSAMERG